MPGGGEARTARRWRKRRWQRRRAGTDRSVPIAASSSRQPSALMRWSGREEEEASSRVSRGRAARQRSTRVVMVTSSRLRVRSCSGRERWVGKWLDRWLGGAAAQEPLWTPAPAPSSTHAPTHLRHRLRQLVQAQRQQAGARPDQGRAPAQQAQRVHGGQLLQGGAQACQVTRAADRRSDRAAAAGDPRASQAAGRCQAAQRVEAMAEGRAGSRGVN